MFWREARASLTCRVGLPCTRLLTVLRDLATCSNSCSSFPVLNVVLCSLFGVIGPLFFTNQLPALLDEFHGSLLCVSSCSVYQV